MNSRDKGEGRENEGVSIVHSLVVKIGGCTAVKSSGRRAANRCSSTCVLCPSGQWSGTSSVVSATDLR
jgi:hypothetical protein